MDMLHPINGIAERIGHLVSQFEPGTSFYKEVVETTREQVAEANTRDDIEQLLKGAENKLNAHLTDDAKAELDQALDEMHRIDGSWPVEEFKNGFRKGTGQELRDDDHAAGRSMNTDHIPQ